MYFFVVLLIGILTGLLVYNCKKSMFNAAGIFIIMWTICLGLACLGLYGMNKPSIIVVCLGCMSMIVFALVFCSNIKIIKISNKRNKINKFHNQLANSKLIIIFHLFAYLFSFPYLLKAIQIVKTQGMYQLRNIAFVGSEYASTFELTIFQTIIAPLFVVTMLLTAVDISHKYYGKKSILLSLIDTILYTLLFGGRYMFFQLLIFFLFAIYDSFKGKCFTFIKRNIKALSFALCIVSTILFLTNSRTSRSILSSLYIYFCGSFSYLSYLIENKIGTDLFLLGRTQFGFIYNFLYMGASFFFKIDYMGSNHLITQRTQYMVSIGEDINFNSLGTILHDFIADYGIYGSILGIFIFAYICKYFDFAKRKYESAVYNVINIYLLYSVVNSVLGYTFRGPGALTTVILIYIFCRKKV